MRFMIRLYQLVVFAIIVGLCTYLDPETGGASGGFFGVLFAYISSVWVPQIWWWSAEKITLIDDFRRAASDSPSRFEASRRLISNALGSRKTDTHM